MSVVLSQVCGTVQPMKNSKGAPVEGDKNLEMALSQIERQFGKGAIMRMGDGTAADVGTVSTGSITLDAALGIEDHELENVEVVGLHDLILRAIEIPGAKPAVERVVVDPTAIDENGAAENG